MQSCRSADRSAAEVVAVGRNRSALPTRAEVVAVGRNRSADLTLSNSNALSANHLLRRHFYFYRANSEVRIITEILASGSTLAPLIEIPDRQFDSPMQLDPQPENNYSRRRQ